MAPVMSLDAYTEPKLLVPRLLSSDQYGAIKELAKRLYSTRRIADAEAFFQSVLEREAMLQTAPERGVVFPHARGHGVKALSVAVGLSAPGITWGEDRRYRAHLIFLLAVPLSETRPYLALLSSLARLGQDEQLRSALLDCTQPEQMLELLNTLETQTS